MAMLALLLPCACSLGDDDEQTVCSPALDVKTSLEGDLETSDRNAIDGGPNIERRVFDLEAVTFSNRSVVLSATTRGEVTTKPTGPVIQFNQPLDVGTFSLRSLSGELCETMFATPTRCMPIDGTVMVEETSMDPTDRKLVARVVVQERPLPERVAARGEGQIHRRETLTTTCMETHGGGGCNACRGPVGPPL